MTLPDFDLNLLNYSPHPLHILELVKDDNRIIINDIVRKFGADFIDNFMKLRIVLGKDAELIVPFAQQPHIPKDIGVVFEESEEFVFIQVLKLEKDLPPLVAHGA